MADRFIVADTSPISSPTSSPSNNINNPPTTPNTRSHHGSLDPDNQPSTTPAGPPPSSSIASSTLSGAPPYLGSSLIRGPNSNSIRPLSFYPSTTGRTPFQQSNFSNAPIGRAIRGRPRAPSCLSRQYHFDDDDTEAEKMHGAQADDPDLPPPRGSLFRHSRRDIPENQDADADAQPTDMDAEMERLITQDMEMGARDAEIDRLFNDDDDDDDDDGSEDVDLFLNMRHDDRPYGQPIIGQDLLMLNTPAATERVRKEAKDIFRRSSLHFGNSTRNKEFRFGSIAKDLYTGRGAAALTEPFSLILNTERLVSRLYDDGVGTQEDLEKMDNSLADISYCLISLWNDHVNSLPQPEGEDPASIGPGTQAEPFERAVYVANLVLRMHHTRFDSDTTQIQNAPPLPQVLFTWMDTSHNLFPDQVQKISQHKPSPAAHGLFWQTLRNALLRGNVTGASLLLKNACWEHVHTDTCDEKRYYGKALDHVRQFAAATSETLDQCPATTGDWDIRGSAWQQFRVHAKGALDKLMLFAEGRVADWRAREEEERAYGPNSMVVMTRKATSPLPWDFYEHLQMVYGILLGKQETILETAQDWCEATIGLFGWWDDGKSAWQLNPSTTSRLLGPSDDYLDRLSSAFHRVIQSDLNPNSLDPVEVAIASAFEGNVMAVIGFIRNWSLPAACAVAEIASVGEWLPPTVKVSDLPADGLDMDDLLVLGITQPTDDEKQGIKDSSLVLYARALVGIEHLSPELDGWEMAIQVLGRMDIPEKSEQTVAELLRVLLETLDQNSSITVNKMWKILNDLGMISFAEEAAERYAKLAKESHRYGEALWYFALSHKANEVREVLNQLIFYSLIYSTPYPPEKELDDHLRDLLRNRTETLENKATQDIEAAQLLGRMLSGYATLRKFYELRDQCAQEEEDASSSRALSVRKQAASALVAVVSSSDDNIRGGLYDDRRDAVVSEDFLLALLGEATVFVNQKPSSVTLDQIDVLVKAIEDVQTVGSRVYEACDDFFNLVLASGQGLKGSTPADLMRKSTTNAALVGASSYLTMTGTSMLASQLHDKSVRSSGQISRGWDWRKQWQVTTKSQEVLRKLRLGLAQDLATLWLEDADDVAAF